MADVKISQLPALTTVNGNELIPMVQGGSTWQATPSQVKTWLDGYYPSLSSFNSLSASLTAFSSDLANQTDSAKGAALVGYDGGTMQAIADGAKTMANYTALRAYTGRASGVRITQVGIAGFFQRDDTDLTSVDDGGEVIVDASGRRWKRIVQRTFYAEDFGVTFDNVTDDTANWNKAILAVALAGGGTLLAKRGSTSYIAGASGLLLPTGVVIDLQGCILRGTGNGSSANALVTSARVNAGALVANVKGQAVNLAGIINGWLYQCKTAMQLVNCIDGCRFENLILSQCYNGIQATFCLYAKFENIMARNTSLGTAFSFDDNCNALTLKNLYAVGTNPGTWAVGFSFSNKTYGVKLLNCSSEYCDSGVLTQEVHGFDIDGHYFEGITNRAIDLGTSAYRKIGVRVSSCTFNSTPVLVYGRTVNDFVWEASNERAASCSPGSIDLQTDTSITDTVLSLCTGVVRLSRQDLISKVPSSASIPSWLLLSNGMTIDATIGAAVATSGVVTPVFAKTTMAQIAPMAMMGYGGVAMNAGDQFQPFQTISYSGGTSFSVVIDTSISYADYGFVIFRFDIQDNVSTYKILGRAYGTDVFLDNAAGKTVVASNSGGKLRLTVSTFSHPSGTAAVTSIVRHV